MEDQAQAQSPEERLMAFVEEEDSPSEQPEEVETEEAEVEAQAAESEENAEADDSDEETTEPVVLKLKHNGQEIEKPVEEVIALAQQGFDYTQKTQQLADERKQIENYAQAVKAQEQTFQEQVQLQTALIQDIAEITAIDKQLSQYASLDWNMLSNQDPVEAQKLFFTYQQLQNTRQQSLGALDQKQQEYQRNQQTFQARYLQEQQTIVEREIPNWGEVKPKIREVGKAYGFNDQELAGVTDARHIKVLHDAMKWRELQATKPQVQNKVAQAKPVIKPGAKDSKQAQTAQIKQTREALRKTGRAEHAAKLIERML